MTTTVTLRADARDETGVQRRAGDSIACSDAYADALVNDGRAVYASAPGVMARLVPASSGSWQLAAPDGSILALSEAASVVTLTASGLAFTGACEFRGVLVRAISGTPQTITVYDATSATGTPIMTATVSALGMYYWDGDGATAGVGRGARRLNTTGCYCSISGGTSRTVDVLVQ